MFFRYNLFTIIWALIIGLLTLTPGDSMPYTNIWDIIAFDKLAHVVVFAILCFLSIIGFTKQHTYHKLRRQAIKFGLLFSTFYGLLLEILQSFSPERFLEFGDILANSLGSAFGYLLFWWVYKR